MEEFRYIDAHTHAGDGKTWDFLEKSGITFFLNTTSMDEWEDIRTRCLKMAERCVPFFGIHPVNADKCNTEWFWKLEKIITSVLPEVKCGIGEIGLDRRAGLPPLHLQKEIFIRQLEIAAAFKIPVSIHTVRSWGLMFDILKEFYPADSLFMLHSYNGSVEMIEKFALLGGYFSFSPFFLTSQRENVKDCIKRVPLDRLFLETDSKRDGSVLAEMYMEAAFLKGVEKESLIEVIWNNGKIFTN